MAKRLEWHNERRKVKDLIRYKHNPRVLSPLQLEGLKRSLKKFNLAEPPCINLDGTLVAGNQRILALSLLGRGEEEIDVRVPNRALTDAEFRDYLLTSNRSGADWDWAKLAEDFDLKELMTAGFDDADLSAIFDDLAETEDDGFDEARELAAIKEPTVRLGEYYQLGDHVLACIDATDQVAVRKLVGETRVDLADVDPPFSIGWSYNGKNGKYGGSEKDDRSPEEYRAFIRALIENALAVAKPDAHFMFWCDERFVWLLQMLYEELGIKSQRLCLWIKDNSMPTPKIAFNKATEFAAYGTRGTPYTNDKVKNLTTILNKEVGSGNRAIEDVIDLLNIWLVKRLPGNQYEHPTEKSPTLHEKALRRLTRPGDAVLDLTAGSGSLLIACEQMKRRAFVSEIDPLFATLIKNRYETLTKNKARKLN